MKCKCSKVRHWCLFYNMEYLPHPQISSTSWKGFKKRYKEITYRFTDRTLCIYNWHTTEWAWHGWLFQLFSLISLILFNLTGAGSCLRKEDIDSSPSDGVGRPGCARWSLVPAAALACQAQHPERSTALWTSRPDHAWDCPSVAWWDWLN